MLVEREPRQTAPPRARHRGRSGPPPWARGPPVAPRRRARSGPDAGSAGGHLRARVRGPRGTSRRGPRRGRRAAGRLPARASRPGSARRPDSGRGVLRPCADGPAATPGPKKPPCALMTRMWLSPAGSTRAAVSDGVNCGIAGESVAGTSGRRAGWTGNAFPAGAGARGAGPGGAGAASAGPTRARPARVSLAACCGTEGDGCDAERAVWRGRFWCYGACYCLGALPPDCSPSGCSASGSAGPAAALMHRVLSSGSTGRFPPEWL